MSRGSCASGTAPGNDFDWDERARESGLTTGDRVAAGRTGPRRSCTGLVGIDLALVAVLLSNLAFLLAVPMAAVASAEALAASAPRGLAASDAASYGQAGVLTAAVLSFSPGGAFASFMYTEGLFVLLVALALFLLGRGWLLGAALVSAMATGTRVTGLAVAGAVTLEAWRVRRERPAAALVAPLISVLGLVAFAVFLAVRFGSPIAFVTAASAPGWGRSLAHAPLELLQGPVRSAYHLLRVRATILDVDPWVMGGAVLLLALGVRRVPAAWTAVAGVGILLPMVSGSYLSIVRYVFPLVPLWASLATRLTFAPSISCGSWPSCCRRAVLP